MLRTVLFAALLCGLLQAQNAPNAQSQTRKQPTQATKNPFLPIEAAAAAVGPGLIERVDFRGSRQLPQDTLRTMILSKVGDPYMEDAVRRDVTILRNTNRFEDVRVSTEEGNSGGVILHFIVKDQPPSR